MRSVKITISGAAFGDPNNAATVAEITRHEMGHVLGLGHANFDDLMDPTVGGANVISNCDIAGVGEANAWAFPGGSGAPEHPGVDHIGC